MICDINLILIVIVVLTWGVIIAVMFVPNEPEHKSEISNDSTASFLTNVALLKQIFNNQRNTDNINQQMVEYQKEEEEEEQEQEHKDENNPIESESNLQRTDHFGDIPPSIVKPLEPQTVVAYSDHFLNSKDYPPITEYSNQIDPRSWNNNEYNDYQFLKPLPYTSKGITSFVDFLYSDFNPVNTKYRINSKGPLI